MQHVSTVMQAKGTRFEYETNMLLLANRMSIPLITVPIDTIYSDNNKASHFRAVRDSARIYWDILKFGCSSGICAVLDYGLFVLLSSLVFGQDAMGISMSAVLARLASGVCNFQINRSLVFKGKGSAALIKYFLLFLILMYLSAQFTYLLSQSLLAAPFAKLLVDITLFVLSFILQRKLVFRKEGGNHQNREKK